MATAPAEPRCPFCDTSVEAWQPICINCGFNLRRRPGYGDQSAPDGMPPADSPVVVQSPDPSEVDRKS